MNDPRYGVREIPLPRYPSYVAVCCRLWDLAYGFPVGRCGLCGVRPVKIS